MICMCLLIERFQRIIILRKVRGHGNIFDSDSAVCSWFCGVVYTTKSHLAVWCTVRSQTLRRDAHCGVMKTKSLEKLRGGMHTAESDSGVSCTPQSQSQRCDAHYGFWLHSVIYCTPRSFLKTLLKSTKASLRLGPLSVHRGVFWKHFWKRGVYRWYWKKLEKIVPSFWGCPK